MLYNLNVSTISLSGHEIRTKNAWTHVSAQDKVCSDIYQNGLTLRTFWLVHLSGFVLSNNTKNVRCLIISCPDLLFSDS